MVVPQQIYFGEVALLFICQEHSFSHSYRFNECSLFLKLRLAFVFRLDFLFRSCYIFASRCIFTSGPCWFPSKELFIKSSNGVRKVKKLYAKKWYKKELM
jgi:hypothetical protein